MHYAMANPMGLEKKDAGVSFTEIKASTDALASAFEAFKRKNDEELAQIKNQRGPDAVTVDEVKRVSDAMTELKTRLDAFELNSQRAPLEEVVGRSGKKLTAEQVKHRDAFEAFVRKGIEDPQYREISAKALSVSVDPDGGYLAPIEVSREMDRLVSQVSPIRGIAQVRTISGSGFKKPFNVGGATSGWVGEMDTRDTTNTPTIRELAYETMELYAKPEATQTFLDDAYVDVEAWLAEEVQIEFAEQEGRAFVSGNGRSQPRGILSHDVVEQTIATGGSEWSWGKLGFLKSGTNGAIGSDGPTAGDKLIDLTTLLKAPFQANAQWLMNRFTEGNVRKLKDAENNYLWRPGLEPGKPSSLLSKGITIAEDMPLMSTNGYAIAYGDFRRGYLVIDRMGIRVLRDPFSNKPYVQFYTTKRVGGGVQNFEAIKLLKLAA
jgi:HK97 family phage major capsid protein